MGKSKKVLIVKEKECKAIKDSFKEKFLEMQERQISAAMESEHQNREFLLKVEERQQTGEAAEKQQDLKFFVQVATLIAKT